jgi:hypothetical protein
MTRQSQKDEERFYAETYLRLLGIDGSLIAGESPDFQIRCASETIGLEVTSYHEGGRRREVEASWEKLLEYSARFREAHTDLNKISVRFYFRAMQLPSPRQFEPFCIAVAEILRRHAPRFSRTTTTIRLDKETAVLARYLQSIDARAVNFYAPWRWSAYNFGGVGTTDDELVAVIARKLKPYPARPKQLHLLIHGGSPALSRIAAPRLEHLERFDKVNSTLRDGPFDTVAILDLRNFVWTRSTGWRPIGND